MVFSDVLNSTNLHLISNSTHSNSTISTATFLNVSIILETLNSDQVLVDNMKMAIAMAKGVNVSQVIFIGFKVAN